MAAFVNETSKNNAVLLIVFKYVFYACMTIYINHIPKLFFQFFFFVKPCNNFSIIWPNTLLD